MSPQTQTTTKFINDAKGIRERVDNIEEFCFGNPQKGTTGVIAAFAKGVGKNIDELKVKTDFMAEWMDAVVGIVGVEKVQAAILETREKKALARAEAQKAELAAEKAKGLYETLEKVEDPCFVILTEFENDTEKPVNGGWFKLHTTQLTPEFMNIVKEKSVGYSERREASTFTIAEILRPKPQPATTAPVEA